MSDPRPVPYEIPTDWKPGGIVLLGRDPGADEVRQGRPFVGRAGRVLDAHLRSAGIRRSSCAVLNVSRYRPPANDFARHRRLQLSQEISHCRSTLDKLRPGVIVALGNEAAWTAVPDWPDWKQEDETKHVGNVFGARDIQDRRGYVWESPHASIGVLSTVHPAAVDREWVPWSPLLELDLRKAKELWREGHIRRPKREVRVVRSSRDARSAALDLRDCGPLACDIETYSPSDLACVGFSGRSGEAVVFPASLLGECRTLLESPGVGTIWQNAFFDLYFLATRCGIRVAGPLHDTMLQWHALEPELAGSAEGVRQGSRRRTAKSLGFLASVYTLDPYWKDYAFADDYERFVLNGRDCCVTRDVWEVQQEAIAQRGVQRFYDHSRSLIWPFTDAHARGLRVDEELRQTRLSAVEGVLEDAFSRVQELVVPLLEERADRLEPAQLTLFQQIEGVCPCCRHGSGKQSSCWSCAGLDSAPSKRDLVRLWFSRHNGSGGVPPSRDPRRQTKAELEAELLGTCEVCGGKPRREWLEFNPRSGDQAKAVLYDLLKLPVRLKDGKPTTDEQAMRSLLGIVKGESS